MYKGKPKKEPIHDYRKCKRIFGIHIIYKRVKGMKRYETAEEIVIQYSLSIVSSLIGPRWWPAFLCSLVNRIH